MALCLASGITDAIFILCQLKEKHLAAKKPNHMAFVNFEKAFNHCPRDVIWLAMCKLGIDKWLVLLVKSMNTDVRSKVRVGNRYSDTGCNLGWF